MAKVHHLQNSWNAGEISPLLYQRIDFDKRNAGSKTLENFIPTKQGPLTARAGTKYVTGVWDSAKRAELIPFQFSTTQVYMIEVSEYVFRFYKDNGLITGTALTGVTSDAGTPVTFTKASHGLANNDIVTCSGFTQQTGVNGNSYAVKNVTTNTFELRAIDGDLDEVNGDFSGGTPETTGGTVQWVGVQHQMSESDLFTGDTFNVGYTQSADTLFLCHEDYHPRYLLRNGDTSWEYDFWHDKALYNTMDAALTAAYGAGTYDTPKFLNGGPFDSEVKDYAITNVQAVTTGNFVTVNLDAGVSKFTSAWVGRQILWGDETSVNARGIIFTVASGSSCTVYVYAAFTGSPGAGVRTSRFRLGIMSDFTGYPTDVTFFQDRLVFGGYKSFPQRIDFSNSSLYTSFGFSSSPTDDEAIAIELAATEVNRIRWMMDTEKGLLVGTTGGEWVVKSGEAQDFITPANAQATRPTNYGSSELRPVKVGTSVVYTQRSRRKVRKLDYTFSKDGFASDDLTVLSEHITQGRLTRMAYQEEPYSVVWFTDANGKLLGMTYDPEQDVTAWHEHTIGGSFGTGNAVIESIAVIPAVAEDRDELWMIVKRTIGGSTVRHVEYMNKDWLWDRAQAVEDAYQVDAGVTVDSPLTITDITDGADTIQVTSAGHGLADGAKVCIRNVVGKTEVNNTTFRVTDSQTNDFELASNVTEIDVKNISQAAKGIVTTFTNHGLSTGDKVTFFDVSGMTEVNGNVYTVDDAFNPTGFTIDQDTTIYTPYTSGGTCHPMIDGTSYTDYDAGGEAYAVFTTVSGLAHLEGETVSVLADGATHADKTVSSGSITLDRDACVAHVGYGYTPKWVSLELEAGGQDGPALGKTKRINQVIISFDSSVGGYIGRDSSNLDEILFRTPNDEMDQALGLYTGYKVVDFNGDYARGNTTISFEQRDPLPCTITSVISQIQTEDRG